MNIKLKYLLVVAVLLLGIGLAFGYMITFSSVTTEYSDSRSVLIPRGAELQQVSDSLTARDILKKQWNFETFARLSGWGDQVKAGHYRVESGRSSKYILDMLRRGLQEPVVVQVPAGTRKERLARALARNMEFSTDDMLDVFADSSFAAELKTDTTHLFGYILPETYFFYWLTSPEEVVRKIKASTDTLIANSLEGVDANPDNLSADEILRLAAIVEWETAHIPEKPTIAGVYLNRIRNRWRLDADPTVQFAVMNLEGDKRRLFYRDYKINHPYNTYTYRGLPPGPITNPSASSIRSVIHPEDHRYFFFVATGEGTHLFSRTLSEHTRRAREYQRVMRERRAAQSSTP